MGRRRRGLFPPGRRELLLSPEAVEAVGRAAEAEPEGSSLDGVTARVCGKLTLRYREGMRGLGAL